MANIHVKEKILVHIKSATELVDFDALELLTASGVASLMKISRNLASQYLNAYVADQVLVKVTTRPVCFFHRDTLENKFMCELRASTFDGLNQLREALTSETGKPDISWTFVGKDGSLRYCVEQCMAAIAYPPNGLPVLLQGATGTGKSMIAQRMYQYAVEKGHVPPESRFAILNCAEFANNPELLMTNLFGFKKGAYTGAAADTPGLIELADGGVLFLDEVHSLKAECQEKLFLFMDQGIFHRVGEGDTIREASVRLIFATTEDPGAALLRTLLRRIPVTVQLPSLGQRPREEKRQLIYVILEQEAEHIGREIFISDGVYWALLDFTFPENVGQLKNCIRMCCANSLLQQSGKDGPLTIELYHMPSYLLGEKSVQNVLYTARSRGSVKLGLDDLRPALRQGSIERLQYSCAELVDMGLKYHRGEYSWEELCSALRLLARCYLDSISGKRGFSDAFPKMHLLLMATQEVVSNFKKLYSTEQPEEDAVFIAHFLQDYDQRTREYGPAGLEQDDMLDLILEALQSRYQTAFSMAQKLWEVSVDGLNLLMDKPGTIFLVLVLDILCKGVELEQVQGVIVARGFSVASSIADAANRTLSKQVFGALDLPHNSSPEKAAELILSRVEGIETSGEVLILADFDDIPLLTAAFSQRSKKSVGIVARVDTATAVAAGEMLSSGQGMQTIVDTLRKPFTPLGAVITKEKRQKAILAVCATGIGTAKRLAELMKKSLPPRQDIQLIPYDYDQLFSQQAEAPIFATHDVLFIVGTLDPCVHGVPFLSMENLIRREYTPLLRSYCEGVMTAQEVEGFTENFTRQFTLENVVEHLTILNAAKLMEYVEQIIFALLDTTEIKLSGGRMIGLSIHICCMIERLVTNTELPGAVNLGDYPQAKQDFIFRAKPCFSVAEDYYSVEIPAMELAIIYDYFLKSDQRL